MSYARSELWVNGDGALLCDLIGKAKEVGALLEPCSISGSGALCCCGDEIGADEVVYVRVGLRGDALEQVAMPGLEVIDPAEHLEAVPAQLGYAKPARPAVVAVDDGEHGNFNQLIGALVARDQRRGNGVVTVGEDVRLDQDHVAHGTLGRELAAIDGGGDGFNHDALASVFERECHAGLVLSDAAALRSSINRR